MLPLPAPTLPPTLFDQVSSGHTQIERLFVPDLKTSLTEAPALVMKVVQSVTIVPQVLGSPVRFFQVAAPLLT